MYFFKSFRQESDVPELVEACDAKRICKDIVIKFLELNLQEMLANLPPNMLLLRPGI